MAIPLLSLDSALDGTTVWEPPALCVLPTGAVQGGAVFGAAIAAMEQATDRPARWASCQFLAATPAGAAVQLDVDVVAVGRSSTQAGCTARIGGQHLLHAMAVLGARDTEVDATWSVAPSVPAPEACEPNRYFRLGLGDIGDLAQVRTASGPPPHEPGRRVLWVHARHDIASSPTSWDLAIIGDLAPMVVRDVLDAPYICSSADNTIRIGTQVPSEWVLLDVHVDQIAEGFAHLRAHLWSHDAGTLLATVAQTATLRRAARAR